MDCTDGSTMFDRYAGHVLWKTECITQHSLNWTRQRTGSQCNCNRHGVTCSCRCSARKSSVVRMQDPQWTPSFTCRIIEHHLLWNTGADRPPTERRKLSACSQTQQSIVLYGCQQTELKTRDTLPLPLSLIHISEPTRPY